jgi:hypothetical protein
MRPCLTRGGPRSCGGGSEAIRHRRGGLRVRERRLFFNDVSGGVAIWFGVLGGLLGWGMLGSLGVIVGFGCGIVFGASYLTKNRYYR